MRISIVIPTYKHLEDLLKPCCESIIKYTDLSDAEVIIVANGCKNPDGTEDGTREYIQSLGDKFKLIWIDEPSGYTKSTNIGIKAATGDYVILFNNDCILLPQGRNDWVNLLLDPMNYNGDVWATGPMKNFCDYAQIEFIIGFCLCLKKEVFETVGLLDEIYSPGYGEETDLQFKILESGHGIVQACQGTVEYGPKRATGNFPIYHAGNETFKELPNEVNDGFFLRNCEVLRKKFGNGINLTKARAIDGWMNHFELRWLAKAAQKHKVVCEIGSWKGRSSRVIADHLLEDGVLYCVDTWNGSINESDGHAEARNLNGDAVFMEFCSNNLDHIQSGKIIPIRMDSVNAAKTLKKSGIKFDMIFIDGEHTYEGCIRDIDAWKEFLADGGLFSGHDYLAWHGTTVAVQEKINNPKIDNPCMNTIWYCDKTDIKQDRPIIFDTFLLNDELDILELRLNTLYDVVDRFVIVEGDKSHNNKPKALNFNDNLKRFEKFLNKITYIVVNDWPATDSWSMERWQRDAIMRGLTGCKDTDIIIHGDCDEIARPEAIAQFDPAKIIMNFNQNFYYYNMTCQCDTNWDWLKITTYKNIKEKTPCGIRYTPFEEKDKTIYNGGWHFSFCTNKVEGIIHKLECTAHQEYNTDEYKNPERLLQLMNEGKDILGRDEIKYRYVEVDETYPKYVLENMDKFRHLIRSKESEIDRLYKYHCENTHTEIFEHLPTLLRYSEECEYITEFGVRDVVSTFAFLRSRPKKLTSYDIYRSPNMDRTIDICKNEGVNFEFIQASTTDVEIEETDLLFIDTLHVYEQLKAELGKHAGKVRKYIIMHDTVTFGTHGELSGTTGLMPAVNEFLASNPQWKIKEVYTNLHGLTILERVE